MDWGVSGPALGDEGASAGRTIDVAGLRALVDRLVGDGYDVYGPRMADRVIGPAPLGSVEDLPLGWTDEQAGGHYRLRRRGDGARFGYAVGPRSWKPYLHPAREQVWTMTRRDGRIAVEMHEPDPARRAFLGVRPCELAAILKQDRVLTGGPHPDPVYEANRADVFIIAVDCGDPAATCFCTSLDTGPRSGPGYDLAMTELVGSDPAGADSRYLVRTGTERGGAVLAGVVSEPADPEDEAAARAVIAGAVDRIDRFLDVGDTGGDIRELVYGQLDGPRWDEIAERCLACGNCTLVCPTCFCTDLEDVTDLTGDTTTRWRVWDTCFGAAFSHMGLGPKRASTAARYRQWFTHKLASWIDQFDESGCVGCGRCITWCPVGIDLTEELDALRAAGAQTGADGDGGGDGRG